AAYRGRVPWVVPSMGSRIGRGRPPASALVVAQAHHRRERVRLAGEHEATFDLPVLQSVVALHPYLALEHPGAAGAADPALARVRQRGAGGEAGIEDRASFERHPQASLLAVDPDR